MRDTIFFHPANLVLDILPLINQDHRFALKGGTAINFFIRALPRLSVDIDLAYLPVEERLQSIKHIHNALDELTVKIHAKLPGAMVDQKILNNTNTISKLIVRRDQARIKIEPNLITRGSVFPVQDFSLVKEAENFFEKSVKIQTLSLPDLYGSKICAALDRQHPRDFFDIMILFENEGITDEIRQAFIVYLVSHNRPMIELLNPNAIEIDHTFNTEFRGMTFRSVSLADLKSARATLFSIIKTMLTEMERRFLLSIKSGEPNWDLFPVAHIKELPAVQWKLQNIGRMNPRKHAGALERLKKFLEI